MAALVDTTVVIDLVNGHDKAMAFCNGLFRQSQSIYISTITAMEVLVGAKNKKEMGHLANLLSIFSTLPLSAEISVTAISLLKGYRLSNSLVIPDALIAATALAENLDFYTGNLKHFMMITGLRIEKPY